VPQRQARRVAAAALSAAFITNSESTVFGASRSSVHSSIAAVLLRDPDDGTGRRLRDALINMHVASCRAASYRLGHNMCIYPSFTYLRWCGALDDAADQVGVLTDATIVSLLGYQRALLQARRRLTTAGATDTVVAAVSLPTTTLLLDTKLRLHVVQTSFFETTCIRGYELTLTKEITVRV
jgi:hypothetical protein